MRLGVLTDVHWSRDAARSAAWHHEYDFAGLPRRLAEAKDLFVREGVDAVCLLGDVTHDGELSDELADLGAPVLAVAGNHDPGPAALAALPGVSLADPVGVEIGGVRVAGMQIAAGGWFRAQAQAPPAVGAWGEEPVVLLSHYPLLSHALRLSRLGMPYPGDVLGRAEIAEALGNRPGPTVVLSGHIHARDSIAAGAVLQLTHAAFVEAPYECAVFEITEDGLVARRAHALSGPPVEPSELPALVAGDEAFLHSQAGWSPAVRSESLP